MIDHQMMLPFFVGKSVRRRRCRFGITRLILPSLCPLYVPSISPSARPQKTPHASYAVHTPAELDGLLTDAAFNVPDRIRLIEVFMPRWVPASVILLRRARGIPLVPAIPSFEMADGTTLCTRRGDAPASLLNQAKLTAEANAKA